MASSRLYLGECSLTIVLTAGRKGPVLGLVLYMRAPMHISVCIVGEGGANRLLLTRKVDKGSPGVSGNGVRSPSSNSHWSNGI